MLYKFRTDTCRHIYKDTNMHTHTCIHTHTYWHTDTDIPTNTDTHNRKNYLYIRNTSMEVISLVTVHYIKVGIGRTRSERVIQGQDRSYKVNQVSTVHEVMTGHYSLRQFRKCQLAIKFGKVCILTHSKLLFCLFRFWIQLYTVNVHIRKLHVQVDTYEEEQLTVFYADQISRNVGLSGIVCIW